MNFDLQIDELLKVLAKTLGLGLDLLGEGDAGDLGGDERPAGFIAFELGDLECLRRADSAFVDASEVQRLVEHVGDGLGLVEHLGDLIAQVVNDLVAATDKLSLGLRENHYATVLSVG